jgi:hypothetical protein
MMVRSGCFIVHKSYKRENDLKPSVFLDILEQKLRQAEATKMHKKNSAPLAVASNSSGRLYPAMKFFEVK